MVLLWTPNFTKSVRELYGRLCECVLARMLRGVTVTLCCTVYRARKSIGIVERGHVNVVLANVLSISNIDACCLRYRDVENSMQSVS
jgi:hypothetical protein